MLKALEILRSRLNELETASKIVTIDNNQERFKLPILNTIRAIEELEEINNRSCIKCNTYYLKCKIFNAYWKKSESSLIIDASSFFCNRYEAKGE